ncbi:MAG: hypothetical protein WD077_01300 [Bacteroidia bacterium]
MRARARFRVDDNIVTEIGDIGDALDALRDEEGQSSYRNSLSVIIISLPLLTCYCLRWPETRDM